MGIQFLKSGDRRSLLFNEIAQEIEQLCSVVPFMGGPSTSTPTKNVFRMYSCNYTMAREYFTILGRMMKLASTTEVRDLLQKNMIEVGCPHSYINEIRCYISELSSYTLLIQGASKTGQHSGAGLPFALSVYVAQLHGLWQHFHVHLIFFKLH